MNNIGEPEGIADLSRAELEALCQERLEQSRLTETYKRDLDACQLREGHLKAQVNVLREIILDRLSS